MRELLEQDHKEKMECLRKENLNMKQVVAQYEKTIVDLTGQFTEGSSVIFCVEVDFQMIKTMTKTNTHFVITNIQITVKTLDKDL